MPSDPSPRERRAWRLAWLLTGDPAKAAAVAHEVLATIPPARDADLARLDRHTILTVRREMGGALAPPRPRKLSPEAVAALRPGERTHLAALALPRQQLEAWVLARIDGLDGLWSARAMDCSKTAVAVHLKAADEAIAAALTKSPETATADLRTLADSLDPVQPLEHERAARARRRRNRLVAILGVLLIVLLVAAWLALNGYIPGIQP